MPNEKYEVTLKSGRKFYVDTDEITIALESKWVVGSELGSVHVPMHMDWLPRFLSEEVECS